MLDLTRFEKEIDIFSRNAKEGKEDTLACIRRTN